MYTITKGNGESRVYGDGIATICKFEVVNNTTPATGGIIKLDMHMSIACDTKLLYVTVSGHDYVLTRRFPKSSWTASDNIIYEMIDLVAVILGSDIDRESFKEGATTLIDSWREKMNEPITPNNPHYCRDILAYFNQLYTDEVCYVSTTKNISMN